MRWRRRRRWEEEKKEGEEEGSIHQGDAVDGILCGEARKILTPVKMEKKNPDPGEDWIKNNLTRGKILILLLPLRPLLQGYTTVGIGMGWSPYGVLLSKCLRTPHTIEWKD